MAKVTKAEMEAITTRRLVGEMAGLFTSLGLGSATGMYLPDLAARAAREIRTMKERLAALEEREGAVARYMVSNAKSDTQYHEKQWRALDLDDNVHLAGPWVSEHDTKAKTDLQIEMIDLQAAGIDLRLVMYERCSYLNLTKQADRQEEDEDD